MGGNSGGEMEEKKKPKILVVDDDEPERMFLRALLRKIRCDCRTAANGREALEMAKTYGPDLIYLDVVMPEMDGIEACKRLKGDPSTRHIPVVMITGLTDRDSRLNGLSAGANDFVEKPVDVAELTVKTANLLKLKEFEEIKIRNDALVETLRIVEAAKREWELTVDCIEDVVVLTDVEGRILRCNRTLSELTEVPQGELLKMRWQDVFREAGFSHGRGNADGLEVHHRSGRCFVYRFRPVTESENAAVAMVITLKDISLRKKTEEEIRKSEERYHSLVDRIPIGIYRTTPEGTILDANPAMMEIIGYPEVKSVQALRTSDIYVNPYDQERWKTLMEREGSVRQFDVRWRHSSGKVIWIRESAQALRSTDGTVTCYEGVVEDITEQKTIERILGDSGRQVGF
jgi:PAS domain S-box-containing protein